MNYLAHAYLSYHHPEITVGNVISDFVKGSNKNNYPILIQKGIFLHRQIDAFTDAHTATKAAKEIFKPLTGLYAGAFVDIVYDYFLAKQIVKTGEENLLNLAHNTYSYLNSYTNILPTNFLQVLPYMQQHNWLYNYQYTWAIEKSFKGLVSRAKYLLPNPQYFEVFLNNIPQLENHYHLFMADVNTFAQDLYNTLLTD